MPKVWSNWIEKLASEAGEIHDYSCLMVDIPKDLKTKILEWNIANIPDSDLFKEDKSGKGRELQPHVTVKYGIHEEAPDPVLARVDDKPIEFSLGAISRFTSGKNYDVIIVEILSPGLHNLNSDITLDFECTDTHPEYKPHLTLAYVNKGALKELDGNEVFKGEKGTFDTFLFTNPKNDLFTKVVGVKRESMRKKKSGFILMESKGNRIKIFDSGLVLHMQGRKFKDETFPCLMSAVRNYEKLGFTVVENPGPNVPMGESGVVEVYPYEKQLHDGLDTSGFEEVGPWDNKWAWKYIAVKNRSFALGYNQVDAVKGIEMELTKNPKFQVGETVSLGSDNLCRTYESEEDQTIEITDEIVVYDIDNGNYIFDLGSNTDIFYNRHDPDSDSFDVRYVSKAIEDVDDSAIYVSGNKSTLPWKEMK